MLAAHDGARAAGRRADAHQRDEAARGRARRARRPRRPRRAARRSASPRTGCSRSARWSRARSSRARPRSTSRGRSSPRSPATIADVQVRNRGTIGGNVCVSDPTNHFPPLLVALDATFTIRGQDGERTVSADEFFVGVYVTAVGEGELLTKINVPASSGAGDGYAGLTIGAHGTYIVNAAATVAGDGARIAIGCVAASPGAGDRDGGASCRRGLLRSRGAGGGAKDSAPRSIRRRTCTARRTSGVTSPRSPRTRAVAAGGGEEEVVAEPVTSRTRLARGERRADRVRGARRAACSSTSSATTWVSPGRTSAATPATAAPAPCT